MKHPERVPESLADAAGIQQEPGVPVMATLTRAFAERRMLVVLDNCEDVLEPVARVGSELLSACPGLKLLATSREPIGAAGEVVVAVAPLGLPEDSATPDPAQLAASESVRLFVERAGAAKPGFALGEANAVAVAEICRRLDGIPLAIELAAARVRMLSVDEIRGRLGDRFKLLTAGGRGAPGRHQTLRATLEWSAEHLSDDERVLFTRLGVFVGAWSLESAVAVAGSGWDEFDVLDALTRLVDRSLVVVTPPVAGETRYRYLETVRHYALERLTASGEEATIRDLHLAHFLAVAEESQTRLAGAEQKQWLARLDVEHSDLLAAHAWCGGDGARAVQGLRLVGALWRYWLPRGHFALADRILGEALVRRGAQQPTAARATALVSAGGCRLAQGDYGGARQRVEEGLSICRGMGDMRGVARCLTGLASIAIFENSLDIARELSTESLGLYRELGRLTGIAQALHTLGYIALCRRELADANAYYEEALEVLAGTGDDLQIAHTLSDFARVAALRGEWDAAQVRHATALHLASGLDTRRSAAYALEGVAELAAMRGAGIVSTRLLGAARALRKAIGAPLTPSESSEQDSILGTLRTDVGPAQFEAHLAAGERMAFEPAVAEALEWLEGDGQQSIRAGSGGR